jgi:hypothetical protein
MMGHDQGQALPSVLAETEDSLALRRYWPVTAIADGTDCLGQNTSGAPASVVHAATWLYRSPRHPEAVTILHSR